MDVPVLSTRRLVLRPVTAADLSGLHGLLSIPAVTRHSNWPDGIGQDECVRFIQEWLDLSASAKGCAWAIETRAEGGLETGGLIGCIRYNYITRPSNVGGIGYELHPAYWRRGLMTEAVRAVVAAGHDLLGANRVEAWTLPGNDASDRVLLKAGFLLEGTLRQIRWFKGRYHDLRWFGRVATDPRDGTA